MTAHAHDSHHGQPLNRTAALATLHCLTGCAIGEVLGMVIGTALGWGTAETIALAIALAFAFGYSLTMLPLLRAGLTLATALPLAFASDTLSIAVMETVDNGVMLAVPGAMEASLSNPLFWGALAFALGVAYVFAFPLNRYLIAHGRGHAVVHEYHHGHVGGESQRPPGRRANLKLAAFGVAALLVTAGVAAGGVVLADEGHEDTDEMAAHGVASGEATVASGLAVASGEYALDVPTATLRRGRTELFSFTVRDRDGRPVRELEEHGGVRMHLIVVRRDLSGYQHLHPTQAADGSWQTRLTLPEAGVYRAYADFEVGGEKVVLGSDLHVGGAFEPRPLPSPTRLAFVDGYGVSADARPEAGMETEVAFELTREGQPVDVEPYLGAAGHLVALRQGDLAYLHVHPLAEERGRVRFAATFPAAGDYRLFFQFADGGRVHTVPVTVSVERRH